MKDVINIYYYNKAMITLFKKYYKTEIIVNIYIFFSKIYRVTMTYPSNIFFNIKFEFDILIYMISLKKY